MSSTKSYDINSSEFTSYEFVRAVKASEFMSSEKSYDIKSSKFTSYEFVRWVNSIEFMSYEFVRAVKASEFICILIIVTFKQIFKPLIVSREVENIYN